MDKPKRESIIVLYEKLDDREAIFKAACLNDAGVFLYRLVLDSSYPSFESNQRVRLSAEEMDTVARAWDKFKREQ